VPFLKTFAKTGSYQSDFYDPTVIDVMLRCCVQDALPLWTVAALCVLANIAESRSVLEIGFLFLNPTNQLITRRSSFQTRPS